MLNRYDACPCQYQTSLIHTLNDIQHRTYHIQKTTFDSSHHQGTVQPSFNKGKVLIVLYNVVTGANPLLQAAWSYGATVTYHYESLHGVAIRLPQGMNTNDAVALFQNINGVLQVQKDKKCGPTDAVRVLLKFCKKKDMCQCSHLLVHLKNNTVVAHPINFGCDKHMRNK